MLLIRDSSIQKTFEKSFRLYQQTTGKKNLSYEIVSMYRPHSVKSWHKYPGKAMDLLLKINGQKAPTREYQKFMIFLYNHWYNGCGLEHIPNRTKLHIHVDLRPEKYFFVENKQHDIKEVPTIHDFLAYYDESILF